MPRCAPRSSRELAAEARAGRARADAAALDRVRKPEADRARRRRSRTRGGARATLADDARASTRRRSRRAVDKLFGGGRRRARRARERRPPIRRTRYLDAEDFARTIHCMGTSLLDWVQDVCTARALRRRRARLRAHQRGQRGRVEGLRGGVGGEGRARVDRALDRGGARARTGSAATCSSRASPRRLRWQAIPGSERLKAQARLRNPFRRLTTPPDVANVVYLLSPRRGRLDQRRA